MRGPLFEAAASFVMVAFVAAINWLPLLEIPAVVAKGKRQLQAIAP